MHVDTNFVGLAVQTIYIVSLSEGVFERRKSNSSKAFSFNMPTVNDLINARGVHLILGVQEGAFNRWEAFKRERRLFS